MMLSRSASRSAAALLAAVLAAGPAYAAMSAEELAKIAQNPVGNLVSVPFQNNTNLNYGPYKGTQNILNIQPVIPVDISPDWNIITRTILPVVWQPALSPAVGSASGLGDLQISAFLSPAQPGNLIWGVGVIGQLPTNTSHALGNERWGLGPTAVLLHLDKDSPWVFGVLANNVWSVSTSGTSPAYNNTLVQPFLNYNFKGGTYLTSAPIITANWKATGEKWTVPVGGGIGHIFHLGRLPVNTQISGYYNVVRSDFGSLWQIRAQVQFMFPK